MDIAQLRQEYTKKKLSKKSVRKDAIEQFGLWLDEAIQAKCPEPTAMVVSTVSETNTPSSRVVLLKGIESGCPVFFTNYKGRKGVQLSNNPAVSALFFWQELERQVNIEGTVEKCSPEYSDAYFKSRPWKSRIGAIISPQSQPIDSRNVIKKAFVLEAAKHIGESIPRPAHWGGYMIKPHRIEFWQGRANRLHDRILFTRSGNASWEITRLAP
jgi:pyridoxamine 5'-phosphate oxidase